MKLKKFEAWGEPDGTSTAFSTRASIQKQIKDGSLSRRAKMLYVVEAATWEEAMAIHSLRQGFGPYVPNGGPAKCPKCSAIFYPEGSSECWKCGPVKRGGV